MNLAIKIPIDLGWLAGRIQSRFQSTVLVNNSQAVAKMLSLMLMQYAIKPDFTKSAAQAEKLLQEKPL